MSRCPYCGEPAETGWEEVRHMEKYHPEVIAGRLRNAGYAQRTAYRIGPDGAVDEDPMLTLDGDPNPR